MRALVVYESIFGNTEQIAQAIGAGLREALGTVEVIEAGSAPGQLEGVDLLVVGGPTHAWGMSRVSSRKSAADQAHQHGKEPVSAGPGIRDWLKARGRAPWAMPAAAFDTAMTRTGWFPVGSAARGASALLQRMGYRVVAEPEQFFVTGTEGPLEEGELERAKRWGQQLGRGLAPAQELSLPG
jgi:hypothetical protein